MAPPTGPAPSVQQQPPVPQPQPGRQSQQATPPPPLPGLVPPRGAQPGTGTSGQGKQNRLTSVPRPIGIDPLSILAERENRIANRIAARIEVIQKQFI